MWKDIRRSEIVPTGKNLAHSEFSVIYHGLCFPGPAFLQFEGKGEEFKPIKKGDRNILFLKVLCVNTDVM